MQPEMVKSRTPVALNPVIAISIIEGLAAIVLALFVPLATIAPNILVLPVVAIAAATVGVVILWKTIPLGNHPSWFSSYILLEQRLRTLEVVCTRHEFQPQPPKYDRARIAAIADSQESESGRPLMEPFSRKDVRVPATSVIWGVAAGMLALCIPMVAIAKGGILLPLAVILATAVSTVVVWYSPNPQFQISSTSSTQVEALEQRIANLEVICGQDELLLSAEPEFRSIESSNQ